MSWKLWLDDQCEDLPGRKTPPGYIGAKSTKEALNLVSIHGMPEFIDFDHDLGMDENGNEDNAVLFIRQLFEKFPNEFPPEYAIHSKNTVGRKNIESLIESWKKSLT